MQEIISALQGLRIPAITQEGALHQCVGQALAQAGLPFIHEAKLAPRCRIDFLVGSIGVEIKKSKPERMRLLHQLDRYAQSEQITALLVITQKQVSLPAHVGGKEVVCLSLSELWGLAI